MRIPPLNYNCYFDPVEKLIHRKETTSVNWLMQVGCFYDICFRLADSVPQSVLRTMERRAAEIDSQTEDEKVTPNDRLFLTLEQIWKDRNYGECLLRTPEVREIVANTILSYDEVQCQVGAFVIMPNHIHLILKMLGVYSPYDLILEIKNNTARDMNKYLGRTGQRWMRGAYNQIIRSPQALKRKLKYLKDNPNGMNIPVYERPDDRDFLPYVTPQAEKAPFEQAQNYLLAGVY